MKNDLTCGLVRDLLPSYVEGLLCSESQEAVDRHLADCPGCAAALAAMREPEAEKEEQIREVDYLKRVKKSGSRKIILTVVCTAFVLLAALLLKVFVIGTPLRPQAVAVQGTAEDGVLRLSLMSMTSANAFHGWRVETRDGVASIYARDVLVSPLFSDGGGRLDVPLEGVREVRLGGPSGKLLWQDGVAISPLTLELMDAKAPYCGDPAALGRIADLLHLRERLGGYTLSLQTARRPYGCTLEFDNQLNEEQLGAAACFSLLSLALVDNLEASRFTYPVPADASGPARTVTDGMPLGTASETVLPALVEAYNAAHGTDWEPEASVKDCARSPADLQRLLLVLESFYAPGFLEAAG